MSIEENTFRVCPKLTDVTISEGVLHIGSYAFSDCINLKNVTVPDSVTSIGDHAFAVNNSSCSKLSSITIGDGVISIGDSAFYGCTALSSIILGKSVASIGHSAFSCCSALTSITIPEGVTSIGDDAFSDCNALTSITIPDSITSIGKTAFCGCSKLRSINIGRNNSSFCSIDNVLFSKDKTTILRYPTGKTDKSYNIPESVRTIAPYAFEGCSSLESITIPDSVTSIGDRAFIVCSALTSITIPEGVTTIGSLVFRRCSTLKSVTIPGSVTSIGTYPFYECSALTDIYYSGAEEQWNTINNSYAPTPENCTIHFNYKPILKLSATPGDKQITLNWSEIPGAAKYGVYSYNKSTKKYTKLDLTVTGTTYTVTGLEDDTEYTFFVQAYNNKWLAGSDESYATAKTNAGITYPVVTAKGGDKQITLSWTKVSGATKYGVYKFANNKYTKVDLVVTGTSYTVTGLEEDTEYTFFVQAYTTKWLAGSDESYAAAKTKAALTYPIVKAEGGNKSVTLTWTEVAGATKYGVYSYNAATNKYTKINLAVTDTSYTVTGLAANTSYTFFVQAYTTKWLAGGDESYATAKTE